MKIRCEVVGGETIGDALVFDLQGHGQRDADWRPMGKFKITVPATKKNGSTFRIGRVVTLDIQPQEDRT